MRAIAQFSTRGILSHLETGVWSLEIVDCICKRTNASFCKVFRLQHEGHHWPWRPM